MTSPAADRLLAAAIAYSERLGAGVVPVVGKRPAAERGYASASRDPREIRRMFGAVRASGVGIAAGERLVLVDVDDPMALASLPGLPRTLTARSGGGGWHLYFARPDGLRLSYRRDRLPAGVEVKLGAAGTVAPPSVHRETGELYRWARRLPPAPAPSWLLERLRCEARATAAAISTARGCETAYGRAALERKARLVASAAEGSRRNTLNGSCFALAQLIPSGHLGPAEIADALAEAALAAGLPACEVRVTIARALADGQARPYLPEPIA